MVGHARSGKGPGTVIQKPIDEGLAEAGLDQKQQAQVTRNIHNLVRRIKKQEFGNFSYICMRCQFTCDGRKQIVGHLESEHKLVLQKSLQFCKEDKFSFILSKLVMTAPFMKSAPLTNKEQSNDQAQTEIKAPSKRKLVTFVNEETPVPIKQNKTPIVLSDVNSTKGAEQIVFNYESRYSEQKDREKAVQRNFSDTELKNMFLAYIQIISNQTSLKSFSLQQLLEKTKTEKDETSVMDLLFLLYEVANGYCHNKDNKPVSETATIKFGKLYMTSGQRKIIQDFGVRSVRCEGSMKLSWSHPDCWRILLPPGAALTSKWGKKEDSELILAAFKHSMDTDKILQDQQFFAIRQARKIGEKGTEDFKNRYGYMMNLYIFRGKYNEEFGYKAWNLRMATTSQTEMGETGKELDNNALEEDNIEMVDLSDDENSNEVIEDDSAIIEGEIIESKNDTTDKKNGDGSKDDNLKSVDETNDNITEDYTHKIKKLSTAKKDKINEDKATENVDNGKVLEEEDSFDALVDQMNKNGDALNASVDSNGSFLVEELKQLEQSDSKEVGKDNEVGEKDGNKAEEVTEDAQTVDNETKEVDNESEEVTTDVETVDEDPKEVDKDAEDCKDVADEGEESTATEEKSATKRTAKSKRGRGRGKNK